ncbi:MAG: hypothetical protein C0436_05645 [Alphaproteobacteria bacterium]|nr:hypothetical protein [Alphaproteobacteria bacterium]
MVRPRILSPEERALWKQVTQHDTKFHDDSDDAEPAAVEPCLEPPAAMPPLHPQPTPRVAPRSPSKQLVLGDLHTLDGLTARRFKRGELPIDRVLDLHGYGRVDAYDVMARTVRAMDAHGERVLAIITGKGRGGEGVLKRELPLWLNDGALRPYIIAATHAPYRMGGEGAVLVMLKRKRG